MKFLPIHSNFSPNSSHLHPLQVENCDSNSRLVVGEDDNGKFRLESVKDTRTVSLLYDTVTFIKPNTLTNNSLDPDRSENHV